jgi:hypothetical protein
MASPSIVTVVMRGSVWAWTAVTGQMLVLPYNKALDSTIPFLAGQTI